MKLFVKDMVPDERISACFVLEAMELRESRNKKPYLVLTLSDRTGTIKGYLWSNPAQTAVFLKGKTFVKVSGTSKLMNGGLLINVKKIGIARKGEVETDDYSMANLSCQMELFALGRERGRYDRTQFNQKEVAA